jgi:hypothetical protein
MCSCIVQALRDIFNIQNVLSINAAPIVRIQGIYLSLYGSIAFCCALADLSVS